MNATVCPGCGADVLLLRDHRTGRLAALDADPPEDGKGNLLLDRSRGEFWLISSKTLREMARPEKRLLHRMHSRRCAGTAEGAA